jgi:hypothetical protein
MRYIEPFSDSRSDPFCAYCWGTADSRDHVPPKVFLDPPYPDHLPCVGSCRRCNVGASQDEQYVACLIEAVVCGSVDPARIRRPKIARTLARTPKLAARIGASMRIVDGRIVTDVETDRVDRVFEKLGRGLYAFEMGEPATDMVAALRVSPIESLDHDALSAFATLAAPELLPEVGSRMMQRVIVLDERRVVNDWVEVQPGQFDYALEDFAGDVRVKFVVADLLAVEVMILR